MELSDPATPDTSLELHDTSNRRKSVRTRQQPVLLQQDPNLSQVPNGNSAKRKRAELRGGDLDELSADELDEESSSDESDPDEEELKERRRKTKKAPPKPAAKKPKTGSAMMTTLAVRPAVNGLKTASKQKKPSARPVKNAANGGTGLYCMQPESLLYAYTNWDL